MEAGRSGFPPTRVPRTQPRAGEKRSRGPGRGRRRWGVEGGSGLPSAAGTPLLHRFRSTSCSHPQTLASEILPRPTVGPDQRLCPQTVAAGVPSVRQRLGALSAPARPQSFRRSFSLCQGVGDCFIFIFLRGQRDETKTPWFSPKPLAAAVRKSRAGRASGWGWRCPRWLETAASGS